MDAPEHADEASGPADAQAAWTAHCLSALLTRHDVPLRHQATEIAQICAISISQARRKLRGAVWQFDEVLALCRHFGESLDTVFAHPVLQAGATVAASHRPAATVARCPADLLIDDVRLPCEVELGLLCEADHAAPDHHLHASRQASGWVVATPTRLRQMGLSAPAYRVDQLHLRSTASAARARIAVVDDDLGSAEALSDWFNEVGYQATAYTSAASLLARPLSEHDAYVVDLILGGGQTSQALVERIRSEQPQAPIVLLTGQLRDGTASEATLTTILRTQGVTFFEKPVRPAVLTAAIQSSLDRQPPQHG